VTRDYGVNRITEIDAPPNVPPPPRWRRAIQRVSAPAASPVAARKLHRLAAQADTPEEITEIVFTFSYLGVQIKPLQLPSELAAFVAEARALAPRTVLEIGTALGGTFCALAWAAADDATLISIDLRHGDFGGGYPRWRAPLYRSFARASQRIVLLRGNSHDGETLDAVKTALGGNPIDVLFIDGDHTYEGVRADFTTYSQLVSPGGLIGLHDIVPEDARQFPGVRVQAGGVPGYWNELRESHEHLELVEDWNQGAFGIGAVRVPRSG
jgi:predicted O-methyltransferase YrrM